MSTQTHTPEIAAHDVITFEDVRILAGAGSPCITIVADLSNPLAMGVRMKNALRSVEKQLKDRGAPSAAIEHLLKPVRDLASAAEAAGFWSNRLILFRSTDLFRCFILYSRVAEVETVDERFQVRPLLAALAREQNFTVLGLSRRHIRLLHCTLHRSEDMDLHHIVPRDFQVWLNNRQPDHVLSNRSTAGPSLGSMKGVRFGMSSDRDHEEENLAHFYKAVDRGVNALVRGESLLLAGTETEVALYRRLSAHPRFFEKHIHGATDDLPDAELHRRAVDLVMQSRSEPLDKALADFENRGEGRRVSFDIAEAAKAAFEGRVADLFVAEGAERHGAWNQETHEVETAQAGEELLNAAALQTVLHGGRAFVLEAGSMPAAHDVVAVLRY